MTGSGNGAGIVIRAAVAADAGRLWALLRDLAVEDGAGARFRATEALVAAHGFGPAPRFQAALAEDAAGRALGFASWFPVYSSFRARDYLLLDNLYVEPGCSQYLQGSNTNFGMVVFGERIDEKHNRI